MNQEEINQKEWENPNNWGGPKWFSVYFSKRDTRVWVPKQIPWMGLWCKKATPNLAHTWGILSLLGVFLFILLAIFVLVANVAYSLPVLEPFALATVDVTFIRL